MLQVTKNQVVETLKELGVQRGDGLLIHSAIQYLGKPVGGTEMYFQAILETVGSEGTIAVPTFNFAFARGEKYHPKETPSQGMGVFSEYVRCRPDSHRTMHPMQSLAFSGKLARDLASRNTPSAFDPGSAFDAMVQLNFKLLLLGASVLYAAIIHYSEQRANVPYRYWKDFTGDVYTDSGWQKITYRMFVRDLELNPQLDLSPVKQLLEERGQWKEKQLNYGKVAVCTLPEFVQAADDLLAENHWALVTNPPTPRHS